MWIPLYNETLNDKHRTFIFVHMNINTYSGHVPRRKKKKKQRVVWIECGGNYYIRSIRRRFHAFRLMSRFFFVYPLCRSVVLFFMLMCSSVSASLFLFPLVFITVSKAIRRCEQLCSSWLRKIAGKCECEWRGTISNLPSFPSIHPLIHPMGHKTISYEKCVKMFEKTENTMW